MIQHEYFEIDSCDIDKHNINSAYSRPFFSLPIYLYTLDAVNNFLNHLSQEYEHDLVEANRLFYCYNPLLSDFFRSNAFKATTIDKDGNDYSTEVNGHQCIPEYIEGFKIGRSELLQKLKGGSINDAELQLLKIDFAKWYRNAIDDSPISYIKGAFRSIFYTLGRVNGLVYEMLNISQANELFGWVKDVQHEVYPYFKPKVQENKEPTKQEIEEWLEFINSLLATQSTLPPEIPPLPLTLDQLVSISHINLARFLPLYEAESNPEERITTIGGPSLICLDQCLPEYISKITECIATPEPLSFISLCKGNPDKVVSILRGAYIFDASNKRIASKQDCALAWAVLESMNLVEYETNSSRLHSILNSHFIDIGTLQNLSHFLKEYRTSINTTIINNKKEMKVRLTNAIV